jgi:plastocyanin
MRRTLLSLLAIALSATFAACGDDSSDSGNGAIGRTDSSKAQITNTGKTATILMSDTTFQPPLMIVLLGTRITWVNKDGVQHDVASTSGEKIDSPLFGKDGTFTFTPKSVGAIDYVCTVHPGMKARIQVEKRQ